MSKFLRLWRPTHNGKHKKLSEEIQHSSENTKRKNAKNNGKEALEEDFCCDGFEEDEIVSFNVKYLGSSMVSKVDEGENMSEHAVQCILNNLKAQKAQKSQKTTTDLNETKKRKKKSKSSRSVNLTISPKGLCVMQTDQGLDLLKISIYRISNCRTHQQRIVSFLATDTLETTECHAFLCKGRKSAENVALAMARAFHIAYEQWTNVAPLRLDEIRSIPISSAAPVVPARAAPIIIDTNAQNIGLLIDFDDGNQAEHTISDFPDDKENDASLTVFGSAWVSFEDNHQASQPTDLLC